LIFELPNSYKRTPKESRQYQRQGSPNKQSENLVPELDPVLSSFSEVDLSNSKIQCGEKQEFGELINQIKAEKNNSFLISRTRIEQPLVEAVANFKLLKICSF